MYWSLSLLVIAITGAVALRRYVFSVYPEPPPGPKGRFWSGNAHQLNGHNIWKKYAGWSQEHGPLIYLRAYSRRFIVINTLDAASELLEKKSTIYSDRPMSWMLFELCGRSLTPFNISSEHPWHKKYRKLILNGLGANATKSYWPILQAEAKTLINGMLSEPEKLVAHIRRNAAGVIMMITYGYQVTNSDDDFILAAEETSKITGRAMAPGRWMVESLPWLRFLPTWLPGTGFKRQALIWKNRFDYLSSVPHNWVLEQIAGEKFVESFTSRLMVQENGSHPDSETEDVIRWSAGGLYAGAADTTVSALTSFVMLMALHPNIQCRAQQEIDEVTGIHGVPSSEDCDRMPFLVAVLKEVLRFAPVGPLALPHKVIQDDEYMGFGIKKDTTIIANIWQMLHDSRYYPNPFMFNPDRFYNETPGKESSLQLDPRGFAFGFGARTCPGQRFAEKWLMLNMSVILASFTISNDSDTAFEDIDFTDGITRWVDAVFGGDLRQLTASLYSHVVPFKCKFTYRC